MATKTKTYNVNPSISNPRYPLTGNDIAQMAGIIFPITPNNVIDLPFISVTLKYPSVEKTYTLLELQASTTHSLPLTGTDVNSNVYNFDTALTEIQLGIPVSKIEFFYSDDVTVADSSHIANIPALIVCRGDVTQVIFSWDDAVVTVAPTFQDNAKPSVGYYQKNNGLGQWTARTVLVAITLI